MVEFDAQDDVNTELLQKLKHLDVRVENGESSAGQGLCETSFWKSLKWKSTLNHIGLLVSLSIYCGVGGLVSDFMAFIRSFVRSSFSNISTTSFLFFPFSFA